MTRMIAKAYRMADAVRTTGIPVVMGGPHVTERQTKRSDEMGAFVTPTPSPSAKRMRPGRESWLMPSAASKEIYAPVDAFGQERRLRLTSIPRSRGSAWSSISST